MHVAADGAQLAGGVAGADQLRPLVATALDGLAKGAADRGGPVPRGAPEDLARTVESALGGDPLPAEGMGAAAALGSLARTLASGAADPADPACAAHLVCPPLAVAVAADLVVSALNPSLDSWDQAPAATTLEPAVIRTLARLAGYDPRLAGGVLTTGGTASNLMGLLLARDAVAGREHHVDVAAPELPSRPAGQLRVFCSRAAHFSVARTAAVVGIGAGVVRVRTDADHRMDPRALAQAIVGARARGEVPAAVVATAGTTDLGSIDPLRQIAAVARENRVWLHVDAAYGGGVLFSPRLAPLLDGLAAADSVALDLHKLGWQPVPAGVFLARDEELLAPLAQRVAYLNPRDDEDAGYPSLLGRSLRTTRRPDAFKVAVTLRALGRSGLAALVERCHALTRYAARAISAHPRLELAAEPVLMTVVFRYTPGGRPGNGNPDAVNAALRRRLLREGRAVVGRTELNGAVHLKLTLLNPHAAEADVDALLAAVARSGEEEHG
ncbi:MAG: pyridoxal phosphate-dependent decarboxylase family protein [Streptomycetales bacterium]